MIDGYVTVMALLSLAVLLATGWASDLLGAEPRGPLLAVLGLSVLLMPFTLRLGGQPVSPAAIPLLALACRRLMRVRPTIQALWLQAAGLLLLSLWLWAERHGALHPSSSVFVRGGWDGPLLCGIAGALAARRSGGRAALLTAVAGAAELVAACTGSGAAAAFGWGWWDKLTLALLSGHAAAACLRLAAAAAVRLRRRGVRFGEEGGDTGL